MKKPDTVFLSGYSQVPKGTSLWEKGNLFGVMLEIDRKTHIIVDSDSTFLTRLARDYLSGILNGKNFLDEFDDILALVKDNMFMPTANSIITALKKAHQRYIDSIK